MDGFLFFERAFRLERRDFELQRPGTPDAVFDFDFQAYNRPVSPQTPGSLKTMSWRAFDQVLERAQVW